MTDDRSTQGLEAAEAVHVDDGLDGTTTAERGASLVEYALMLAMIAIVCISAITLLGGETDTGNRGLSTSARSIVTAGTP